MQVIQGLNQSFFFPIILYKVSRRIIDFNDMEVLRCMCLKSEF